MLTSQRLCKTYDAGLVPYRLSWEWQRSLVQQRKNHPGQPDILLLVEHPPVYTLGQGASLDFLKFDPAHSTVEVYRIERGGEVTYHCPGQLVGYPILDLNYYQRDLHWYLRQLEEVLILTLKAFGLPGNRIEGLTGVWIDGVKVGAIGIKVSRWITMHGFALNVCPDMSGFQQIVPCGIADRPVGSLQQWIPDITVEAVQPQLVQAFATKFGAVVQSEDVRLLKEEVGSLLFSQF